MAKRKKNSNGSNGKGTIDMSAHDYKAVKVVGKDGKTYSSIGNQDSIQKALALFRAAGKDITLVVKANKLDADRYDVSKWKNRGLHRMAIGNALRALVNAGTPVHIGNTVIRSRRQRVALTESV